MCNAYLEHMNLHKYTIMARGQDRVKVMSMIDLVLVKKYMLHYMKDVRGSKRNGTRPLRSVCCTL